jgi:hypothetical protein
LTHHARKPRIAALRIADARRALAIMGYAGTTARPRRPKPTYKVKAYPYRADYGRGAKAWERGSGIVLMQHGLLTR